MLWSRTPETLGERKDPVAKKSRVLSTCKLGKCWFPNQGVDCRPGGSNRTQGVWGCGHRDSSSCTVGSKGEGGARQVVQGAGEGLRCSMAELRSTCSPEALNCDFATSGDIWGHCIVERGLLASSQ